MENESKCFWFSEIEGLVIRKVYFDKTKGLMIELEDILYDDEDIASEKAKLNIKSENNMLRISLNKNVSRYLMFGMDVKEESKEV